MQKKVSMLPLFVADALMFLAVFLIALPNIFLKEPLDVGQTFALCAVVLIAMFMILVPIILNYKFQNKEESIEEKNQSLKTSQELQQIFADLRTLRDSLIEQIKKIDIAGEEIEKLHINIINLESSLNELKKNFDEDPKLAKQLDELNLSISNLKSDFENIKESPTNDIKFLKEEIENLSSKTESKFQILDEICEQLQSLADSAEENEDNADDVEEIQDEQVEEDENQENLDENLIDDDIAEDESYQEDLDDDFGKDDEEVEEIEEIEEAEEPADVAQEPQVEEIKTEPKGNPKWSSMLDKAFQNSQSFSTRETVSRFIEKNKQGDAPEESNAVEAPLEKSDISNPASSISIEDLEKTETYKEVEDGVNKYEEKIAQENMLFSEDELPQTHKPKRLKNGDTAVVVNAFLGIGNVPYLRGNGAGLNQEKGIPMDLLEIGKYQWKCEAMFADPVKISIWLNDEIPSNLGELTLNPNETLDIDPSFE